MKNFLIILFLVFFYILSSHGSYYYSDVVLGLSLLALISCGKVYSKFGLIITLTYFYALIDGIYLSFHFPSPFINHGFAGENFFKYVTAQSSLIIFMTVFLFSCLDTKTIRLFARSLPWIAIVSSVFSIYDFARTPWIARARGIMGNATMDPMLIGILFPVCFELIDPKIRGKKWFTILVFVLTITSIILSMSSIGYGAITLSMLILLLSLEKITFKQLMGSVLAFITVFYIGRFYSERPLFHTSYRFGIYQIAFDYFYAHCSMVTGCGVGTFWGYGPMMGDGLEFTKEAGVFPWLHSDWLQIGFELGSVGLIISILSALKIILNCLKNKRYYILASVVSYSGSMMFNMPIHWFWSLFIGIILARLGVMDELEYSAIRGTEIFNAESD